jgi:hypothetical protein
MTTDSTYCAAAILEIAIHVRNGKELSSCGCALQFDMLPLFTKQNHMTGKLRGGSLELG